VPALYIDRDIIIIISLSLEEEEAQQPQKRRAELLVISAGHAHTQLLLHNIT
jgi:hypothetical protein